MPDGSHRLRRDQPSEGRCRRFRWGLARASRRRRWPASRSCSRSIAAIYGLEEVDGKPFLVLELVEGETLQDLSLPGLWMLPSSVSPDGRFVAFGVFDIKSGPDVWIADLEAKEGQRARPFLVTRHGEWGPAFSPDGRFVAYLSDESGDGNIYVRRFPEGDAKTRVSIDGGVGAQWSRDGTELFYQSPDGRKLMAVSVAKGNGLSFSEPRVLFEGPYLTSLDAGLTYAVSPDARRFLMTRQANVYPLRATELVVVQNWFEDVRRLTAR